MDDPRFEVERLMPWEFTHPHPPSYEDTLLRERESSFWSGAALLPFYPIGPMFYFPPHYR